MSFGFSAPRTVPNVNRCLLNNLFPNIQELQRKLPTELIEPLSNSYKGILGYEA